MVPLSRMFESIYAPEPILSGSNLFDPFDGKKSKLFKLIKLSSNSANLVFSGLLSPIS